jgi:subtilisin family serine protease
MTIARDLAALLPALPIAPRRSVRLGSAAAVLLAAALATSACAPAQAQSRQSHDGGGRGGHGGGGRGFPSGAIGPLIGLGGALLIEATRPRERVVEEVYEDDEPRPRRPRRPKAGPRTAEPETRPRSPKTVKAKAGPRSSPKDKAANPGGARTPPRPAPAAPPPRLAAADPGVVPGEVLFEVRNGVGEDQVAAIARASRLDRLSAETFELSGRTLYRYRIRGGRPVAAVLRELDRDTRVRSAQPNHVYRLSAGVAARLAESQYAVAKMRLREAQVSASGEGVLVAVIDSGVDPRHPALVGAVTESFDAVGGAFKAHAHGTAVAGLVAGRGEIASPAPGARILAIRAFSGEAAGKGRTGQEGTTIHILRGLDAAAKRGAKVVNMSFAGPQDDRMSEFVAAGARLGTIHVAAAGNAGSASPPLYPAADPNVIAVTATDAADRRPAFANRGAHLCVAAPGVDVLVARPGAGFGYLSGTSMSAAGVSGVVALLAQARPALTAAEARAALMTSAVDLGAPGFDPDFGAGATDARAALDALGGPAAPAAAAPAIAETASARP